MEQHIVCYQILIYCSFKKIFSDNLKYQFSTILLLLPQDKLFLREKKSKDNTLSPLNKIIFHPDEILFFQDKMLFPQDGLRLQNQMYP